MSRVIPLSPVLIPLLKPGILLVLAGGLSWASGVRGADIEQRTAMVCVPDESRQLTAFGNRPDNEGPSSNARSRFGQWLFSANPSTHPSTIRFLWIPSGASGPTLKVHTTQTHHVLVNVRSQGRDSVVAVSSASDPFTVIGWLFSINFKLEQIVAASVQSNSAGSRSESVRFSCRFENRTPEIEAPAAGKGVG